MFKLPIMLFIIGIMSVIQISIWQIFPPKFRDVLLANPALAFIVNLAGSSLILSFTGVASMVGLCNLGASIIFGIYAYLYKQHKQITGIGIKFGKILNIIPIIPQLYPIYKDKEL